MFLASISLEGIWAFSGRRRRNDSRGLRSVRRARSGIGTPSWMDDLAAHKRDKFRWPRRAWNCRLPYLPPYSPSLNLVEEAFGKTTGIVRRTEACIREVLVEAPGVTISALSCSRRPRFLRALRIRRVGSIVVTNAATAAVQGGM